MKDNYVPSDSNTDESSVASHSCTVGNSIEQPTSHDTFVIGMNGSKVMFFKSYNFKIQREEAMRDLDYVQDKSMFSGWFISQANNWSIKNIIDENEDWNIEIKAE